ncbi:MAG: caspase family protein [Saprospiraceae bacterium]
MSKKLYVLSIGVNKFAAPDVSNLLGCENDATNIYKYLEESSEGTDFEMDGKLLLSEEATKENVVNTFTSHLGQAKAGDVAVFYFSGHGAEEKADEVFQTFSHAETFTTMVCHDSRTNGVSDFADKELRYLIHKISGNPDTAPHFVLITDSCHSGGSTRSMDDLMPRLTGEGEQREWSDFIFSDTITRDMIGGAASLRDVMPEGTHVHLSSCEDTELAYEIQGSGVFTSALLDILRRSSGKVSYSDINSRIRLLLGGRYPQKPTIYATDKETREAFFLGGASENKGVSCNIAYNLKDNKWVMDMGAVHGVSDDTDNPSTVRIMDYDGNEITVATVENSDPSKSSLEIDAEILNARKVSKQETYIGVVENLFQPYISIHLTGDADGVELLENYFVKDEAKVESLDRRNIKIVENEIDAQYVIRAKSGQFLVTMPFDERPLVRQLFYTGKNTFSGLDGKYLINIPKWEFLRSLHNSKSRLRPKPAVEIKVYKAVNEDNPKFDELLTPVNGEVFIENGDSIRIEVVNNNRRKKLYYTLFYMDQLFGIMSISNKGDYLNPDRNYWVQERESIEFEYEDYIEEFNFERSFFVLKCVYSTSQVDLHNLEQDPLDEPIYPALGDADKDRPLEKRKNPNSEDWGAHDIMVVIKNKNFDKSKGIPT